MPFPWSKEKWNPYRKHCYVTGGSTGLGLELAVLLASKGAHVTIVARNEDRLEQALARIEAVRQSPDQIFRSFSFSLHTSQESIEALEAATHEHGGVAPDAVFLCAGKSTPKFFIDTTPEDLEVGMKNGYWIQAWTAWAATQQMVRQKRKGKVVFVSSTLGYMSFIGYSSYSPPKHALRGLADELRSELLLYDIDVQIFFPCTMFTPGYEEENKTKPKITLEIEKDDPGLTATQAAQAMFRGIEKNQAHITADFITNLFRASTCGSTPAHNFIVDAALGLIARIAVPIWASSVDSKVKSHREEHMQYLAERGIHKPS